MGKTSTDDDNNTGLMHISVPNDLKTDLKSIAKTEYRTLNNLVVYALYDFVKRYNSNKIPDKDKKDN